MNTAICITPIAIIFLCSSELLNLDIAFITTAVGSIAIDRTNRIVCAVAYSIPIMARILAGATMSAAIRGAVRLKPILRLPDDKSVLDSDEAGITVNDILDARPAPTILIIKAM